MNDPQESLFYWQKILDADPDNKVILTRIGDSHRAMNNLDTAREYYSKALNIEFDSYAVLGLALINKEKGNYLEAIESLSGLLVNDVKNPACTSRSRRAGLPWTRRTRPWTCCCAPSAWESRTSASASCWKSCRKADRRLGCAGRPGAPCYSSTARILRTPAEDDCSFWITNFPRVPVRSTWGPPQTSFEKSPIV